MTAETLPPPDANGVDDHAAMSRQFINHACSELEKGNQLQASEKVWGATAHGLKAIAIQRGWRHRSHGNILDVGEHLAREFNRETEFLNWLNTADAMHQNFYENHRGEGAIRFAVNEIERFLGELDMVRISPPLPFTVADRGDSERLARLLGLRTSERPDIGTRSEHGFSLLPTEVGDNKIR